MIGTYRIYEWVMYVCVIVRKTISLITLGGKIEFIHTMYFLHLHNYYDIPSIHFQIQIEAIMQMLLT